MIQVAIFTRASTGLTYLSARYYDPTTAKFTTPDPLLNLAIPQWANPYSYAASNPIGLSDPTGLKPKSGSCADQAKAGTKKLSDTCQDWAEKQAAEVADAAEKWRKQVLSAVASASTCVSVSFAQAAFCQQLRGQAAALLGNDPWALSETQKSIAGLLNSVLSFMLEDINGCINGSVTSCALFAASFTPGEKLAVGAGKLIAKTGTKFGARGEKVAAGAGKQIAGAKRLCNSFVPGTSVLMADGSHKRIEDVKVGDKVLATDPVTGKTEAKPVIALISSQGDKNLVQITVDTDGLAGDKTGIVIATAQHPFWSADQHHWFTADQLTPGMQLRSYDGTELEVLAIQEYRRQRQHVHNLTIDRIHTYYVAVGGTDVLVHNANPCLPDLKMLHPVSSLNKSSLDYWRKQDTDEIIKSLRKGSKEPLIVKEDGTVMQGNTRIYILMKRGVEVNKLPRTIYKKDLPADGFWD